MNEAKTPGTSPRPSPVAADPGPIFRPDATEAGKQAVLAFRRDLPRLLRERPGQWVLYHGDRQVAIAPTDLELCRLQRRLGIPNDDSIIAPIEPELPDVVYLD
jgi:hypothetical protein